MLLATYLHISPHPPIPSQKRPELNARKREGSRLVD